jgi:hypothetical protein
LPELAAKIAVIGEHVMQSRKAGADNCLHQLRALAVLYIGSMEDSANHTAVRIGDDM